MEEYGIREPAVAGSFYPDNPAQLKSDIERYLQEAKPPVNPAEIKGLICPHAGYIYSGGTAAHGYKLLIGNTYKRVIVFALSHRVDFRGASVFPGKAYQTPLGLCPVDQDFVGRLLKSSSVMSFNAVADQLEHSLEVQVPFLQVVLKDFLLVPILIREQTLATCVKIVDAILKILPENERNDILVVGSTDLYHGPSYNECRESDELLAKTVLEYDEKKFEKMINHNEIMACGPSSVMSTMLLCRALGAGRIDLLHLTNSADVTGQRRSDYVVGYLSAVLY